MLGAMHSRGSLGRGSICDSGISASEAALGVGELGEPLRTVCSSCLHVVTAMNLWQFVDDKTAMHRKTGVTQHSQVYP